LHSPQCLLSLKYKVASPKNLTDISGLLLTAGLKGYFVSLERLQRPPVEALGMFLDGLAMLKEELGFSADNLFVWPAVVLLEKLGLRKCTPSNKQWNLFLTLYRYLICNFCYLT
jgi:hypothetical protein